MCRSRSSRIVEVLDRFPQGQGEEERSRWRLELERSLNTAPSAWVSAAGPPGSLTLATDRAWVLLSWAEDSASELSRSGRRDLVETASFAMSLLEASPLDRRDVMVVAMLVRRAATIAGLPYGMLVERGCRRAGALGASCSEWLLRVSDATPSTHEEIATGRRSSGRTHGHRDDGPAGGDVWPAWLRYPVIVVLCAVGLIGVIVVLFDRGWLPLAGPFAATVVASTLVVLVMSWRNRRVRRLSEDAVRQLQHLAGAIARERAHAPDARPTQASDQSLTHAAEQVELALQRFAWGQEAGARPFVEALAATARDSWLPSAPLSHSVDRLARTSTRLDERLRKMLAAAERRRR
jgi:hypothetical protein